MTICLSCMSPDEYVEAKNKVSTVLFRGHLPRVEAQASEYQGIFSFSEVDEIEIV